MARGGHARGVGTPRGAAGRTERTVSSRGRHVKRRFAGKAPVVLLVVFGLLAAGGAGSAFAALRYDGNHADRILPGVTIDGVDVSNMTRAQALSAVSTVVDRKLAGKVHVAAAKRTWDLTVGQLGLTADVDSAVDRALELNTSFSWVSRVYHRLAHKPVHRSFEVPFGFTSKAVKQFVQAATNQVGRPSRNAGYALVDGRVVMIHAHPGRALMYWQSRAMLQKVVQAGGGSVTLPLETVAPKVPDDAVGKAIVVNRSSNMLTLYDDFQVERTYPVATARPGFETPPGAWEVVNKVEWPTWVNPCLGQPGCWAASEPATIPPGPDNPLGTRALYLSAPGIRIHGTPSDDSIGTYASHGCIRMHIPDSEAMYPLVPIGTPVLIYGSPPWGNGGSSGVAGP